MESDLPDSILSFIFNKLSFKDRVKTFLLSKHWLHEWRFSSTTHLNFDLYNTPATDKSQFTARLDQFMLHYEHATISSIRVKFPLGYEHNCVGRNSSRFLKIDPNSKLRHLNMIDCGSEISAPYMIYIDAKNLSSFEYSGVITRKISVMAPKLLEIFLNASVKHKYSGHTTTAPKLLKVFWNAAAALLEVLTSWLYVGFRSYGFYYTFAMVSTIDYLGFFQFIDS
ncbi:putative F-box/FBD/LRR-repeat protein At1g66300 [Lathyrus oleraceus]|uniref:putative F-box/FBD/LRR-repeat protein At1g66300 n=1 Tax=Pisum sativum TaxID=3888 RepID=UPI0021CE335D|nr:putative F-box/FBD/LRR-repeat protein At1g66300 [Pisum sativum]